MIQKSKLFNNDELNKLFFYKGKDGKYIPYYRSDIKQLNPLNPFEFNFLFKEFNLPFIEMEWVYCIKKHNDSLHFVFPKYLALMKLKGFLRFNYGMIVWLDNPDIIQEKTLLECKPFIYNLNGETIFKCSQML